MTAQDDALRRIDRARTRPSRLKDQVVTLAHGAGGKASATLIDSVFLEAFGGAPELGDAALLELAATEPDLRLAFSTDSYVVSPIRFPGASIGELAVNGTVNDLAVSGAQPRWLSAAFIVEEGFAISELRLIATEMRVAADRAGVRIVAGDTKVVPRGAADQLFITTAGVGVVPSGRVISARRVQAGDQVILSGPIAAHGMAVMVARGNLAVSAPIRSDSAPVNHLVEAAYAATGPTAIHWMRDATRGGVATILNELAADSELGVLLADEAIRVEQPVRAVCELLGIDPLYVANEGVFVAVVGQDAAEAALVALRGAGAPQAAVIGHVVADLGSAVAIRNAFGGTRLVDTLAGDPLPRIC